MSQDNEPGDVAAEVGQALSAVHSILSRVVKSTNVANLAFDAGVQQQLETIKRAAERLTGQD